MPATNVPSDQIDSYQGRLRWLPLPSLRVQKFLALFNLICQIGIATTGVTVRVTASGLGCDTWPRCNAGSYIPVPGAMPMVHQAVEFGNRLLTFVLVAAAAAVLLALYRAGRRKELIYLAWTMPAGILAQAVIGGITVLAGLVWWTVALHLLPSMALAWLSCVLYVRIGESDSAESKRAFPRPLRAAIVMAAILLFGVLATGTMVTGAGPHAGDDRVAAEDRLQISIQWLVHFHSEFMVGFLFLIIGVLFGLFAVRAGGPAPRRAAWLIGAIIVQAAVGITQYWMGVPELLVVLHVTLASVITALCGALWAAGKTRPLVQADRRVDNAS